MESCFATCFMILPSYPPLPPVRQRIGRDLPAEQAAIPSGAAVLRVK